MVSRFFLSSHLFGAVVLSCQKESKTFCIVTVIHSVFCTTHTEDNIKTHVRYLTEHWLKSCSPWPSLFFSSSLSREQSLWWVHQRLPFDLCQLGRPRRAVPPALSGGVSVRRRLRAAGWPVRGAQRLWLHLPQASAGHQPDFLDRLGVPGALLLQWLWQHRILSARAVSPWGVLPGEWRPVFLPAALWGPVCGSWLWTFFAIWRSAVRAAELLHSQDGHHQMWEGEHGARTHHQNFSSI